MNEEEYEKGEVLFEEGDQCDRIYFIVDGMIELEVHDNEEDKCIVIEQLRRGDIIG